MRNSSSMYDDDDVIDAEIIADAEVPVSDRRAATGLVLAARATASEPQPEPSLFTLPPELDPQLLIANQHRVLEIMLATLEGRGPVPSVSAEPAQLESSEEFLARAMAHLDRHMAAMDATLERLVGAHWTSPTTKR